MTTLATTSTDTPESPAQSAEKWAYLLALVLVAILVTNTALFGLAGLSMTAVILVPVIFLTLLIITIGG